MIPFGGGGPFSQNARFDQVFMRDDKTLYRIVELSGIKKSDTILEIGTGTGNLTRLLAAKAKEVITIEIDQKLKPVLKSQLRDLKNVRIIWGNALGVIENGGLDFNKIVSNPPYSISEPLVKALFKQKFECAILTLPWRFVERLTANPEERRYSKLSMFAQAFFSIKTILQVPDDAWHPRPDTTSVVIRLSRKDDPGIDDMFIQGLALQSDKKLKNAIREVMVELSPGNGTKRKARDAMDDIGLSEKVMDKKISEMKLGEIREAVDRMGESL